MKPADFQDAVDRLGHELATWPDDLQQQARDLLDGSAAARAILAEAAAMRRALASPEQIRAPRGLADRIVFAALGTDATTLPSPTLDTDARTSRHSRTRPLARSTSH